MKDEVALLLLRCAGLYLALGHGLGKVQALVTGEAERFIGGVAALGFPAPTLFAWAAALAELAGGLLVFVGLFTRPAAVAAAFTMLVAAFVRHHAIGHWLAAARIRSYPEETLKGWGNPELALIYLLSLLAIVLLGPGRYSLDHAWRGKKSGRSR